MHYSRNTVVAICIALLVAFVTLVSFLSYALKGIRQITPSHFWATLPNVGVDEKVLFGWTRAILKSVTKSDETAFLGYQKYSRDDRPFVVPSTGCGSIVVIPPSQLNNVLNKPESQVQAFHTQHESLQSRYTMGNPDVYENMIHFDIVRNQLTKNVGFFASITDEEVKAGFEEYCGMASDRWTNFNLWEICTKVIARAGNRGYVGLPLCRDESLLESTRLYSTAVYTCAAAITALPSTLRPILGPIIALPAQRYQSRCKAILIPFVKKRLDCLKRPDEEMPDDALQWLISRCRKAGPAQMDAEKIAQRLLILNLVSIYTTTYAFANCVLDIYSSPCREDFIAGMRAECAQVASRCDGLASKAAIDQLFRVDSAVRESMRTSGFGILALFRETALHTHLELGNGIRVPGGVRLGVPFRPIHLDESRYDNASKFDAFRYSRPFEGPEMREKQAQEQKLSVTLDDSFLTYGYGIHACPGRWLASQMMKQALAHLLQHYDVEVIGDRPKRRGLLNMIMPPEDVQVRIRRRR